MPTITLRTRVARAMARGIAALMIVACTARASAGWTLTGDARQWHTVTLLFDGPASDENAWPSPFRHYRLTVTFTHAASGTIYVVPGHFAADGNAAETSVTSGSIWRCHFAPGQTGTWTFAADFVKGNDVALAYDTKTWRPLPGVGTPTAFHGTTGSFEVGPSDAVAPDFRSRGTLRAGYDRYPRFAGSGEPFVKFGTDSPENFLAYYEFDGTSDAGGAGHDLDGPPHFDGLHHYDPHLVDWMPGDPTWQGGAGKRIVGAINYLASEGVNSAYMLTMNVDGDGRDVHPWNVTPPVPGGVLTPEPASRFDVSKLDQWEIVFGHMSERGVMLHLVTQEQENDQLIDGGQLGPQRRLYYRELISRFAHHPALVWNLGEENTNTAEQRRHYATFFKANDAYQHPVVIHTFPSAQSEVYEPMLGFADLDGPSLQNMTTLTYDRTRQWIEGSAAAERPWFVCQDEIGPADTGVMPDGPGANHDALRRDVLWANLMAGGAGVEWYFGYGHPHSDLDCEDFRSRDTWWDQNRHAATVMRTVPFWRMTPAAVSGADAWALVDDLAHPEVIVREHALIYYRSAANTGTIDLDGSVAPLLRLDWYDPRCGAFVGDPMYHVGEDPIVPGPPPCEPDRDWVLMIGPPESFDCDENGVPDEVDIAFEPQRDLDLDGRIDACGASADCNENGLLDACEIASGALVDCDADGVPDDCETLGVPGLAASYWNDAAAPGGMAFPIDAPDVERVDPAVNFDWGATSPDPTIAGDGFACRWSGYVVTADLSGSYRFTVRGNDGVRLWIDGVMRIDAWHDQFAEHQATVTLSAGTAYALELEHYEGANSAVAQLRWTPPGGVDAIIPTANLRTGRPACACVGPPCSCPGDQGVGFAELMQILAAWGPCAACDADQDGDGQIGFSDLTVLLNAWGPC